MDAPKKSRRSIQRREEGEERAKGREDRLRREEGEEQEEMEDDRDLSPPPRVGNLYVMKPRDDCDEELANFHETLFPVMELAGVDPKWISREDVMRVSGPSPDFFVLPQFTGEEYQHLINVHSKVVGPFVVDKCLKKHRRMPKWTHPVYALAMEGAFVCFSGFKRQKKTELGKLVRWMGGVVTADLHDKVTVLVADHCDTNNPKYNESVRLKLPVLKEDWVTDSWKSVECLSGDDVLEKVMDTAKLDAYKVPLFKNMVITLSGLRAQERVSVSRAIEANGGKIMADMKRAICTHLVVNTNAGEKYKKAREWNIRIVGVKWIMRCMEAKYVLKEHHFDPERVKASTPSKGPKPLDELEDISMVSPCGHSVAPFNNSTLSMALNTSHLTTPVNATATTSNTSVVRASFSRNDSALRTSSLLDATDRSLLLSGMTGGGTLLHNESVSVEDISSTIDLTSLHGDADFFESMRILFVGVPEIREAWWRRLINWTGASRAMKVEVATHVVVVGQPDRGVLSTATERGIPILTANWVVESAKAKKELPVSGYMWSDQSLRSSQSFLGRNPSSHRLNSQRQVHRQSGEMAVPSPVTISGRRSITNGPEPMQLGSPRTQPRRESTGQRLAHANSAEELLSGITFKCIHMDDNELEALQAGIEKIGGTVCRGPSSVIAHYLLCPLLEFGSLYAPTEHGANEVVTPFWLERCVESGTILSPTAHPLYRPLPAVQGSQLFHGIVVTVFGFESSSERDAIEHLIGYFGGHMQDKISKVNRGSLHRTTHVVVGAESEKLTTMRTWGIKVVDPSWVIECIINDKVLLEEPFSFKVTPYSGYEGRKDDLWSWEQCERARNAPSRATDRGASATGQHTVLENEEGEEDGGEEMMTDEGGLFDEDMGGPANGDDQELLEDDYETRPPIEEDDVMPSPAVPSISSPGRTTAETSMTHPRLRMLRSSQRPRGTPPIVPIDSPSRFLHPKARPGFVLNGADEIIDLLSSPCHSDAERSHTELSTSMVGRLLNDAVERTGRMGIETPTVRGTSRHDVMNPSVFSPNGKRSILDTERMAQFDDAFGRATRNLNVTPSTPNKTEMRIETDTTERPRQPQQKESAVSAALLAKQKENLERMAAMKKKKNDEEGMGEGPAGIKLELKRSVGSRKSGSTTATSGGTSTENEAAPSGLAAVRTRRKRAMAEAAAREEAENAAVKRRPTDPDEMEGGEERPSTSTPPAAPIVNWDTGAPLPGHHIEIPSRFLESPEMPTPKRVSKQREERPEVQPPPMQEVVNVVDVSDDISSDFVSTRTRPSRTVAATPRAKTMKAERSKLMADKTQAVMNNEAASSSRKAKSTAPISRRGRPPKGKENEKPTVQKRVFAITSVSDAETKRRIESIVAKLGGEMSSSPDYDPSVTHLISGKMARNEKVLGAIASGQWIVGVEYLEDSEKEGRWLQEDEYEWSSKRMYAKNDERSRPVAAAATRWRKRLTQQKLMMLLDGEGGGKMGAFEGWCVLIYSKSKAKEEGYYRIVQAGGGTATLRSTITKEQIQDSRPTHVVVDNTGPEQWNLDELRLCYAIGAPCLQADYLFKVLVDENADISSFYLKEYKTLLDAIM